LTDISMGAGMSGWDLASHVQARWRSIPIVLATGWGVEIDAAQARTRGIAGVLAKPFRVSDLRETVANLTADA
jgi:CheY-like chemotaxis protein